MGWENKLKKILKIGTPISGLFLPSAIGNILDKVNKGLQDSSDSENRQAIEALTEAVVNIDGRLSRLENK